MTEPDSTLEVRAGEGTSETFPTPARERSFGSPLTTPHPAAPEQAKPSSSGQRHAFGTGKWTACGRALLDVYIDPVDVDCPACRRSPVEAARFALGCNDPAELRRLAVAALRAADDLEGSWQ